MNDECYPLSNWLRGVCAVCAAVYIVGLVMIILK